MKVVIVTILLGQLIHNAVGLKNLDEPRWKSFIDAQKECAEYLLISDRTIDRYVSSGYPDELSVQKLIYCILTNLNSWNETSRQINENVFNRYSGSYPNKCLCRPQAKQCLSQLDLHSNLNQSEISQAYNYFMCYYQNCGILENQVQWIPFRESEIQQVLVDSIRIIPQPRRALLQYCQGFILEPPEFSELMYAFIVRSTLYNRSSGFDLQKLHTQFGMEDLLTTETCGCIDRVAKKQCAEPARAMSTLQTCFTGLYLSLRKLISSVSNLLLGHPVECLIGPKFSLKNL